MKRIVLALMAIAMFSLVAFADGPSGGWGFLAENEIYSAAYSGGPFLHISGSQFTDPPQG